MDAPATIKVGKRTFTVLFPDLLRTLTADERSALKASIRKRGVETPVLVDEDDGIIDGINRLTILAELGIQGVITRTVTPKGMSLDRKREIALEVNDARRHLKPHERKELAEQMEGLKKRAVELRAEGRTLRQAADETGLSTETVRKVAADPTFNQLKVDAPALPEKAVGRDGKARPTRYRPRQPKAVPEGDTATPPPPVGGVAAVDHGPPDEGGQPHPMDFPAAARPPEPPPAWAAALASVRVALLGLSPGGRMKVIQALRDERVI